MRNINKLIATLFSLCIFVLFGSGLANAATDQAGVASGFKVSPLIYEISVAKGATHTETVYVTNVDTTKAIIARPIVNDFLASSDESGRPQIMFDANQSAPNNSFKAIVNSMDSVTIQPGQTAKVSVVISVPKNAEPGGYYGVVRFVSGVNSADDKSLSLSASVGTLFLVTVPGKLTENLSLKDFSAAHNGSTARLFVNVKDLSIITRLRNTGNIHVAPFGAVTVSKGSKVIEVYEFNNTSPRGSILPNSIRKFEDKLKNKSWSGKYTITASLGYGTTGNLVTMKNTFWVIPLWFVIVVPLIILIVVVSCYLIYRKYRRSKHKIPVRR